MGFGVLLACGVAWAAAGDLDPSFSGDGKVFGGPVGYPLLDLVRQPDGKLAAGGFRRTEDPLG
jgi:hypothetical protein